MKYDNIERAVFRSRPNRFIAQVDLQGHTETVHVKNYWYQGQKRFWKRVPTLQERPDMI